MIKFKEHTLASQLMSASMDERLLKIVLSLAGFCALYLGRDITITEIYRTKEMQDSYYKDNKLYQSEPWDSVHQYWRGIDISVHGFDSGDLSAIANFLDGFEYKSPKGLKTYKVHDIGLGNHIHIQVDPSGYTKILA